ncbi:hypothetical protein EYF80_002272 [Liparis tanakae]|uniref:Uncharacterized protein n=1 Tax=Liparis tanakae TaxID=230148 RepID=A0A4Z2JB58_9TELE|nr:hypothetical protein EYF80_002272 [Liparis tanakae]
MSGWWPALRVRVDRAAQPGAMGAPSYVQPDHWDQAALQQLLYGSRAPADQLVFAFQSDIVYYNCLAGRAGTKGGTPTAAEQCAAHMKNKVWCRSPAALGKESSSISALLSSMEPSPVLTPAALSSCWKHLVH